MLFEQKYVAIILVNVVSNEATALYYLALIVTHFLLPQF